MPSPQDRSLNAALAEISGRLGELAEAVLDLDADSFTSADPEAFATLCGAALLARGEPARSVICNGCERSCPMPVEIVRSPGDAPAHIFVVCDKRDDIGRVPVVADRLRRWRLSLEQIARTVADLLATDRPAAPSGNGRSWELGRVEVGRERIAVRLDPDPPATPPHLGLTVTLSPAQSSSAPTLPLSRLVSFHGGVLRLDVAALKAALRQRLNDPRIACEIRCERGDIVLVNHVTGSSRTLASPHFNSSNDNAFQVLYRRPGRHFTLAELQEATSDRTIADLHKIVENLGFEGALKKLFFRVSKAAICFDRTATLGQMATLRIDLQEIS